MTILIIEDENLAARKLKKLVIDLEPMAEIVGMTDSIEASVEWLESNPAPDLILMDIELADGQSFEIFNRTTVTSPIVFTTAYDEFALKAFKVNSIDYLLKPIRSEELEQALGKFKILRGGNGSPKDKHQPDIEALLKALQQQSSPKEFRERFLIKHGQRFITIEVSEIAYFFTEDRLNFIRTRNGQKHIIDYTLDELDHLLDPKIFFRANRQVIVHVKSIDSVHPYFNSKLKISIKPAPDEEVVISREKAAEFKDWLGA